MYSYHLMVVASVTDVAIQKNIYGSRNDSTVDLKRKSERYHENS